MEACRNKRVTREKELDANLNRNHAGLFGFEDGYRNDLRFIPVAMRYRLDLAGLKIGLDAWLKIPLGERFVLSAFPVGKAEDLESFQARFLHTASRCIGSAPDRIPRLDPRAWGRASPFPASVKEAGTANGVVIEDSDWDRMTELQRYALWKFSLSKRQPESFRRAWDEFTGRGWATGHAEE